MRWCIERVTSRNISCVVPFYFYLVGGTRIKRKRAVGKEMASETGQHVPSDQ